MDDNKLNPRPLLTVKGLTRYLPKLDQIEQSLCDKGFNCIAGVDEVGRGPLAGPVVAAAVILPQNMNILGLDDSKKVSPKRREILFDEIIASGAICSIGIIDNEDIDKLNILKASLMAMRKAVCTLDSRPEVILVDGSFTIPNVDIPQFAVVGGDALCKSISAASIIAKVTRDRIMEKYQDIYPEFSFARHKGYPTSLHIKELKKNGPTEIHRYSFKPVTEIANQTALDL